MTNEQSSKLPSADSPLDRKNNFGFLRLLFATLVIVSHSAEIIDGNRSREPLTNLFGSLPFGELSVDGFFVISGYLVAKSYQTSASVLEYLSKRVCRIYPGYLVAYFVCIFVVGPFVGVAFDAIDFKGLVSIFYNAILLRNISLPGFIGLPYQVLNGSLWTILIEFRCYLLVVLFSAIGLYRNKWIFAALTLGLLFAAEANLHPKLPEPFDWIAGGDAYNLIRLLGMFCVGTLFYLFGNSIPYNRTIALVAAGCLLIFLSWPFVAESGFAVFGGYLIFWTALYLKSSILRRVNARDDISYGVYLYAWPVQSSLVYFYQISSPWLLTALTIPIVYTIGSASWRLVERRFLARGMPPSAQATISNLL